MYATTTPSFPRAVLLFCLRNRAPLVIHCNCRQGSHRFRLRADPALARRARRSDCRGLSAHPTASTGVIPQPAPIFPEDVRQVLASVETSFLGRRLRCHQRRLWRSRKTISATPWASAVGNAQRSRRDTWRPKSPSPPKAADKVASGRRFHFGIEVRDDVPRMPRSPC